MKKKYVSRAIALLLVVALAGGGWFGYRYFTDPDRLDYSANENPYPSLKAPELASMLSFEFPLVLKAAQEVVVVRVLEPAHDATYHVAKDGSLPLLEDLYPGDTILVRQKLTVMEVVQSCAGLGALQEGDSFVFRVPEGLLVLTHPLRWATPSFCF